MPICVTAENGSYEIILQTGAIKNIAQLLNVDRRALIVTDSGVPEEYAQTVASSCRSPYIFTLNEGESSKSFENLQKLLSVMLNSAFSRGDCVIAVGGGVPGDLGGFAASVYMRGIDFYNIPTTLLSQVDSSVGGKTAVDFEGVKNIVGTFYQPKKVIIDPSVLCTLSKRQFMSGLAESIKMAATCDAELFRLIENSDNIYSDIKEIIKRSLLIKRDIVQKDAKENGLRRVLNFGHTVGHAIESRYAGDMLHGECVAAGMLCMSKGEARERIKKVLQKYSLPTEVSAEKSELLPYILHDKKSSGGMIQAVYTNKIGTFEFADTPAEKIFDYAEKNL